MAPISISKGNGDSDPQSFTQMADKDLESIGRHCQYEYCNQLDFLPFRCESCRGTYCLDHRTETAHSCPQAGEWARRRNATGQTTTPGTATLKPTIYNSDQCAHLSCKTLINTLKDPGVRCPDCSRQYCLKHRLREEHDCDKVGRRLGTGSGANAGATPNETIRSMFARVRSWGKDKSQAAAQAAAAAKPKPKPNSPAARAAQVNALKKAAKGDASVPADKRVYLHVVGTSETQSVDPPAGDFWFDSRWKVGRVLDDAAKRLRVENVNNRAGEEARLRLFHVESGEFLEFADAVGGGKVKTGDTIVLLRGAGVMLGK
ncbi:AN1-type zinc finger protein [Aspergillus lucknowensis]|uniref:AN1 zinc finger protein n=1 Tax=Aspergillus lucknowensis TaxID=176173 RepID=A0ABR4LQM2_9EURO